MAAEMIEIDGSMGEGGGQVLRASLALSMALGKPFYMKNIRAGRPKSGLKRQHLTCVQAAQRISGAEVSHADIGSTELSFAPQTLCPGEYRFDIGSGGSCTLVLQALIPPLLAAHRASRITVTGGTHVPHAPSFEFMQETLFPWLEKLGPRLSATMEKPGFMQVGGGLVTVDIAPAESLLPFDSCEESPFMDSEGHVYLWNLDPGIAARELRVLLDKKYEDLGLLEEKIRMEVSSKGRKDAHGPGNAVLVKVRHEKGLTVCTGIGARGHSAERVAREACERAFTFMKAKVPVDHHLADQLIVPMALAGGGAFLTEKPTLHTETCMALLPYFTDIRAKVLQENDKQWLIQLEKM